MTGDMDIIWLKLGGQVESDYKTKEKIMRSMVHHIASIHDIMSGFKERKGHRPLAKPLSTMGRNLSFIPKKLSPTFLHEMRVGGIILDRLWPVTNVRN